MNEKIRNHIEMLFFNAPRTRRAFELKEELLSNSEERYQDLIANGVSPEDAFQNVVNSIGNVSELFLGLEDFAFENTRIPYEKPKTMYPIKIVIIVLTILLSITMLSFAVISVFNYNTKSMSPSSIFKETTLVNTQTIALNDINSLSVEYHSDDVLFYYGDTDELVLKEYMNFTPSNDQLAKLNQNGDHVTIKGAKKNFNINFSFGNNHNSRAEIYLPSSYSGDLKVTNSSGDIDADLSLNLTTLNAESSSGDIIFSNVSADVVNLTSSSGSIRSNSIEAHSNFAASSTSGDMKLKEVYSENIIVSTSSGSIGIQKAEGNRQISSNSGDIKISDGTGDSIVSSSSGSITLMNVSGQFDIEANSGDIKMEAYSGGGSIKTSSGKITLDYMEDTLSNVNDLKLSSSSGDVNLNLPSLLEFNFTADTSSGDILTFFDKQLSFNKKGNHATGAIGDNPSMDIQVNTTSGTIKVK